MNCSVLSKGEADSYLDSFDVVAPVVASSRYLVPDGSSAAPMLADAILIQWDELILGDHDGSGICVLAIREWGSNRNFEFSLFEKWMRAWTGMDCAGASAWLWNDKKRDISRELRAFLFMLLSFDWSGWMAIPGAAAVYRGDGFIAVMAESQPVLDAMKFVCENYELEPF